MRRQSGSKGIAIGSRGVWWYRCSSVPGISGWLKGGKARVRGWFGVVGPLSVGSRDRAEAEEKTVS